MADYVMRVTIFCDEPLRDDANQLALCLGQSAADVNTFGPATYQNPSGDRFSVASTVTRATFPAAAAAPLVAPDFAPAVDLVAAGRAQAVLVVYDPLNPVQAAPGTILAIIGEPASAAIAAAGVTPIDGGA